MTTPLMMTEREIANIAEGLVEFLEELPPIHPTSFYMFVGRRAIARICGSVFVGTNTTIDDLREKRRVNSLGVRRDEDVPGYYVYARATSALLLSAYSDIASYPMISKMLELDHSTIMHAMLERTQTKYLANEVYARGVVEADRRMLGMVAASWSWLKDRGGEREFLEAHKIRITEDRRATGARTAGAEAYTIINQAYRAVQGCDSPVLRLRNAYAALEDDLGAQNGGGEACAG